jgi:hypothetical protein
MPFVLVVNLYLCMHVTHMSCVRGARFARYDDLQSFPASENLPHRSADISRKRDFPHIRLLSIRRRHLGGYRGQEPVGLPKGVIYAWARCHATLQCQTHSRAVLTRLSCNTLRVPVMTYLLLYQVKTRMLQIGPQLLLSLTVLTPRKSRSRQPFLTTCEV